MAIFVSYTAWPFKLIEECLQFRLLYCMMRGFMQGCKVRVVIRCINARWPFYTATKNKRSKIVYIAGREPEGQVRRPCWPLQACQYELRLIGSTKPYANLEPYGLSPFTNGSTSQELVSQPRSWSKPYVSVTNASYFATTTFWFLIGPRRAVRSVWQSCNCFVAEAGCSCVVICKTSDSKVLSRSVGTVSNIHSHVSAFVIDRCIACIYAACSLLRLWVSACIWLWQMRCEG